jgi:ribonuclease HI
MTEHTHIATDSASALWQIRNCILYPQRMKRHEHVKLFQIIVHHILLSKDTIHLYKGKAHAGILGNECADAIAKCSAENKVAMIFTLTLTPTPIHS